jgi:hypothetical protein
VSEEQLRERAAIRQRDIAGLEFVLAGGEPEEWAVKVGLSPKRGRALVLKIAQLLHMRADKSDGLPYPERYVSLREHASAWLTKLNHNRPLLLREEWNK